MALTREQADKIKIDGDVIVGFSGSGGDVCAEQLAKWAYRRLETWPDLLEACKHGAMSSHHPACSHGKRGDGNTCGCHVKKCQDAIKKVEKS